MKKTIIYLSMAFLVFTNVSFASNFKSSIAIEVAAGETNGTPLCLAISKGEVELVKKFIEYGSDINETSNGMTPLMYAARYNNVEILKLLIDSGANLNIKDEKGFTALKHAEISNAKEATKYLKIILTK